MDLYASRVTERMRSPTKMKSPVDESETMVIFQIRVDVTRKSTPTPTPPCPLPRCTYTHTLRFEIEGYDVVEMGTLQSKLLITRPFVESNGGVNGGEQLAIKFY